MHRLVTRTCECNSSVINCVYFKKEMDAAMEETELISLQKRKTKENLDGYWIVISFDSLH